MAKSLQNRNDNRIVTIKNSGNVLGVLRVSSKVNDCVGENNITDMWKTHFSTLLNSVGDNTNKPYVEHFLLNTRL